MKDDACMSCWSPMFPSPPVGYGEEKRRFLCGDCDSDLVEESGLVWDENASEWSYHPAERCPFCGAKIVDPVVDDLHKYECGCSLWYGGDSSIIDAPIETEILCDAGLEQAPRE